MIEFILLAAIAVFIGWRLYVTLGQDSGPPKGRSRQPAPPPAGAADTPRSAREKGASLRTAFTGPGAAGLEAIHGADPSFDPRSFMQGARAAYEMIVSAYARGDRDTLRPMLDTDVYEAWDAAISEREAKGVEGMQLLRIRRAEISDASLDDHGMARVVTQFEAELGDGENMVRSSEVWTFMRDTRSSDPNWLLADVDSAD